MIFHQTPQNKNSVCTLLSYLDNFKALSNWQVLFCKNEKELKGEILKIDLNRSRTIVAFSFLSTQQKEILKIVQNLRSLFSEEIVLLAGGPHCTALPENALQMGFRYVVKGEGEFSLLQFMKAWENGTENEIEKIPGICFYKNDKLIQIPNNLKTSLNTFIPCSLKYNQFGYIEITRGCPFACHFCQTSHIFGTETRHRSIDNLVSYAEILHSMGYTDFRTLSPNAMAYGSKDGFEMNLPEIENMLAKVSEALGPKGRIFFGSFPSEVRPEHITKDSLGLILKFAANKNIIIGVQSGSQKILNACNRGNTVDHIYNAVKLCAEKKIKANLDFIFGLPGESEKETNETFQLIDNLLKMGKEIKIHAHYFLPLPGTSFWHSESVLPDSIRKKLNLYVSKGFIYGPWTNHEKKAFNLKLIS